MHIFFSFYFVSIPSLYLFTLLNSDTSQLLNISLKNTHTKLYTFIAINLWPNGLTSRHKFWTCVQLAFRLATHLRRLASTWDDLRGLALTLVEFKFECK